MFVDFFAGAVFTLREAVIQVGGYEVFRPSQEDVIFCCKLRNMNWNVYRVPVPMITHFDTKILDRKRTIRKRIFGTFPLMTGVQLRHAIYKTGWWPMLLYFFSPQIIHGLFFTLLGGLFVSSFWVGQWSRVIQITILASLLLYFAYLLVVKRSLTRAGAALILRTIYFINLIVGFLFYHPRIVFGFQMSKEYRQMVAEANKGFRHGETGRLPDQNSNIN